MYVTVHRCECSNLVLTMLWGQSHHAYFQFVEVVLTEYLRSEVIPTPGTVTHLVPSAVLPQGSPQQGCAEQWSIVFTPMPFLMQRQTFVWSRAAT